MNGGADHSGIGGSHAPHPQAPGTGSRRVWCEWAWLGGQAPVAGVVIEVGPDGRLASVVRGGPPADAERLPGLTLPGLANAHSHAFHRALRGRTHSEDGHSEEGHSGTGRGGGSFWTWREVMYRAAERLDPDSYLRLARAAYAEMALAGVVGVGEFHYLHHGPGGLRYSDPNAMSAALVEAAADAGVRITLLDVCYLSGGLGADGAHLPLTGPQLRFGDGTVGAWAERVDAFSPRGAHARVGVAAHSVRAVPGAALPEVAKFAEAGQLPLHVHVSEQPAENAACLAAYGRTPVRVLAEAGALTERTTLVHATHLTDTDVDTVRAHGSAVCLCPTTERDLADGLPRTGDLVSAPHPVPLSLGTDQHAQTDLFEEARAVELHERLRTHRRGGLGGGALLRAATVDGHAGLGWHDAGTLAPGARADLVNVSLDSVRLAGADPERATDAVVFAATAADVRHVMVDGRWTVRDGVHTRLPDTARELDTVIKELL